MTLISLHLSTFLPWEDPFLSHIMLQYVTSFGQLENGKCDLGKGQKELMYWDFLQGTLYYGKELLPICEMVKLLWSLPSCNGTDFHIYK